MCEIVTHGSECNCCGGGPVAAAALGPGTPLPKRELTASVGGLSPVEVAGNGSKFYFCLKPTLVRSILL